MPRKRLWRDTGKVREQIRIGKVPHPREVIGHGVAGARDMGDFMTASVMPAMETAQAAKVGGRGGRGGTSTFAVLSNSGSVIIEGDNGPLASIAQLIDDVSMGKDTGLFEVAVGDVSGGIVKADDVCLDVIGERSSPDGRRRMVGSEEGSTHDMLAGICGSDD